MRFVLYGIVGLVGLALMALGFLYVAAPTQWIEDRLVAEVKSKTGRDLVINGGTSLTVWPQIGVAMRDIVVSAPAGMPDQTFATVEKLELAVALWPLMQRRVEVARFVLDRPVIELVTTKDGQKSWSIAPAETATASTGAAGALRGTDTDTAGRAETRDAAEGKKLKGLAFGDVRIVNGTLRYRDETSGARQELTGLDLTLSLASISEPLSIDGSASWRGQKLPFTASIGSPEDLLDGKSTPLRLDLAAAAVAAKLDGTIETGDSVMITGALAAKAPSVRKLIAFFGAYELAFGGLGALALDGKLDFSEGKLAVSSARLSLDGAKATGAVAVATGGARPLITADLAIDKLDLDVYLGKPGAIETTASTSVPADTAAPKKASTNSQDRAVANNAWRDDPIALTGLGAVDVDAKLIVGAFKLHDIKTTDSDLRIALKDGLLKTRFAKFALYEGQGIGNLALDSRGAEPRVDANFTVNGVSALPLLRDAAAFDWLAGRGDLTLAVSGRGATERQIITSLTGQGRLDLEKGAVVGLDLPQMLKDLKRAKIPSLDHDASKKTGFDSLSGSFAMTNGVATTDDLKLTSPSLSAATTGSVNMPNRTLDLSVRPTLFSSATAGTAKPKGLTIPVVVRGPWAKPKVTPDLDALGKDPGAIADAVKDLTGTEGQSLGEAIGGLSKKPGTSRKLKKLLKDALGGDAEPQAQPQPQ